MTYDVEPNSGNVDQHRAQLLHEFCVNELNINTYDVLATAHGDGRVTLTIEEDIARD